MPRSITYLGFALLLLIGMSCKKPYTPNVVVTATGYLVVDGVINTGGDSTQINLSRTTKLSDTTKIIPVLGATVYVEDDKNNRYALNEFPKGLYKGPPFSTTGLGNYRVHIFTSDQKEYVSDYSLSYVTPSIDTITYMELPTGVQFFTSTHDPTNNTKYYRWNFDETWEYTANIDGGSNPFIYDLISQKVRFRNALTENVTFCWVNTKSNVIALATTNGLSQSVITRQPIAYVDISTYKLRRGYSMLLHQYSLSKEAYEYWQQLKKNTEQLGSIFDAQPTDLQGNLHSLNNPAEPVLGYVSASTVTSKRIFIDSHNLNIYQPPPDEIPVPGNPDCGYHNILFAPTNTLASRLQRTLGSGDTIITGGIFDKATNAQIGYGVGRVICEDCTKKIATGTNFRPPYWPANL